MKTKYLDRYVTCDQTVCAYSHQVCLVNALRQATEFGSVCQLTQTSNLQLTKATTNWTTIF